MNIDHPATPNVRIPGRPQFKVISEQYLTYLLSNIKAISDLSPELIARSVFEQMDAENHGLPPEPPLGIDSEGGSHD